MSFSPVASSSFSLSLSLSLFLLDYPPFNASIALSWSYPLLIVDTFILLDAQLGTSISSRSPVRSSYCSVASLYKARSLSLSSRDWKALHPSPRPFRRLPSSTSSFTPIRTISRGPQCLPLFGDLFDTLSCTSDQVSIASPDLSASSSARSLVFGFFPRTLRTRITSASLTLSGTSIYGSPIDQDKHRFCLRI